jgi:hypothetical protein
MEAQKNSLATLSPPQTSKPPGLSSEEAIRQFLVKAGEVYGKQITAPLVSIWTEELSAHPPDVLGPLFRKALRTCKFFPTLADILEPLQSVKQAALPEEAGEAWQKVLAIRRKHYNPDFPRHLACAMAELPERVQRAARAAGVFREFESTDDLHTWAKKKFIESYLNWNELEENQFLLPEGEMKNLLSGVAARKALPAPVSIPSKQIAYTPAIAAERMSKQAIEKVEVLPPVREIPPVIDFEGRMADFRRQAELIRRKYPTSRKEAAL